MQKSEKFFIFSWKELLVIALLVITLVGFFFTLGLHYGKKLHPATETAETSEAKLEESPESLPAKEVLDKGAAHSEGASEEAIQNETEAAVKEANLKIDHPKPVDLPNEKAEPKAEVKTVQKSEERTEAKVRETHEASSPEAATHYAVQLGSFTSQKEAKEKIAVYSKRGVKTEIRTAQVNNETRYRIVIPGFKTRAAADTRGKALRITRKAESFVVIKSE